MPRAGTRIPWFYSSEERRLFVVTFQRKKYTLEKKREKKTYTQL